MRATINIDHKEEGYPTLRGLIENLVDTFQEEDLPLEYITITEDEAEQLIEELSAGGTIFTLDFVLQQFEMDQVDYKGVPIVVVSEEPEEDIIEMEVTIADI